MREKVEKGWCAPAPHDLAAEGGGPIPFARPRPAFPHLHASGPLTHLCKHVRERPAPVDGEFEGPDGWSIGGGRRAGHGFWDVLCGRGRAQMGDGRVGQALGQRPVRVARRSRRAGPKACGAVGVNGPPLQKKKKKNSLRSLTAGRPHRRPGPDRALALLAHKPTQSSPKCGWAPAPPGRRVPPVARSWGTQTTCCCAARPGRCWRRGVVRPRMRGRRPASRRVRFSFCASRGLCGRARAWPAPCALPA